jgi:hypothetical protein
LKGRATRNNTNSERILVELHFNSGSRERTAKGEHNKKLQRNTRKIPTGCVFGKTEKSLKEAEERQKENVAVEFFVPFRSLLVVSLLAFASGFFKATTF